MWGAAWGASRDWAGGVPGGKEEGEGKKARMTTPADFLAVVECASAITASKACHRSVWMRSGSLALDGAFANAQYLDPGFRVP